jgi:hypothetical protein
MKTESQNTTESFLPSIADADGIPRIITGINRLVKLSLVIEGKVIKYYKHFQLNQHKTPPPIQRDIGSDALGDRQTHTLEEANKFSENV